MFDDVQQGKTAAYEFLFKVYYPRLRTYASHFIKDLDDVDDIIQDCFVHLWEHKERLTFISISALLFTMTRNGCLNYLKREAQKNNYTLLNKSQAAGSERLYQLDFLNSTDEPLLYDELHKQIQRIMDTLPARSRQVFMMSRFEGLKNREIAEQLGISVKVVEKHITKALAIFRKQLAKDIPAELQAILIAWYITMS